MALPKSNRQLDPKPLPYLGPLQKTAEQKNMMRRRHEGPMPPAAIGTTPPRPTAASPQHAHLGPMALPKSNRQPDPKLLPHLRPLQKTAEQKNMMR